MEKEFDIIVFGGSGYTGRYVTEELAKCSNARNLKWAVAGRNVEKLKESVKLIQLYLDGIEIPGIPIIKADVTNKASILSMCSRAKIIFNCVGPYNWYGEVVVAACIDNGTHHVDISAEMKYLETTQAKYFNQAREKKTYIIQACGFGSIPTDYGITLLKDQFQGELNSVESYIEIFTGPEGRVTNIGTWMSAVHSARDIIQWSAYTSMLKNIFGKEMPKQRYAAKLRFPMFFSDIVKDWCVLFFGPDYRVVQRTQMLNYHFFNDRPIMLRQYMKRDGLIQSLLYLFFVCYFGFLSLFSFGRNVLGKFPYLLSAGEFNTEGPTRKQVEEGSTKVTLCGEGWREKTVEPSDVHTEPPNKKMTLEITGPEPAYVLTSICMVQAGLVLLEEEDRMPLTGGVFTPGAAFAKTSLHQRLQERGISFRFL